MAGLVEGLRKVRSILRGLVGAGDGPQADGDASGPTSSSRPTTISSDPRRYKRAMLLAGGAGVQQKIASAAAQFRDRPFPVVDLSHTGVAIDRMDITEADMPDESKPELMVLNVGMLPPFSVHVTLARSSDRVLAFEFVDVTTDGRLTIDRFLDPKMIGLNMRAVDRAFFSPGETFSLWFCGPRDTNFFLWMSSGRLDRAIIQLGDEQFTLSPSAGDSKVRFVRNIASTRGTSELRDSILFALDVALQVKNGGDAISELVKLLTEAADALQPGA